MKLSERIRTWTQHDYPEEAPLQEWADEAAQLEAEITVLTKDIDLLREANGNFAQRNFELEPYALKLESEIVNLEDENDRLRAVLGESREDTRDS